MTFLIILNKVLSIEDTQVNVNGTNISTTIEGLTPNTTYYVRAFLTNTLGEFYSNEVSFSTEEEITGSCDGAPYPSIVYGTQEWTVENACHTTYRDGTPIPQVTDNDEWRYLTTGAWCYYGNDPTNEVLYNWYAVAGIHDTDPNTPNKEFAPEGWHAPSNLEWTTLENYLIANGYNYDGTTTGNKIAKSMASTTGWLSSTTLGTPGNNQSTNNSSGFNAFHTGTRSYYGTMSPGDDFEPEEYVVFWSSTGFNNNIENYGAFSRNLYYDSSSLETAYIDYSAAHGFPVRLVKD
ncbi:hypothetical protein FORMB_08330 [Formosa sp. Hel1_33_131]|nr:hypothetical protein FORMB_08330 [Formosa sp. Hel1_33_131]